MINFPRLNIATSTVNRILNTVDELNTGRIQQAAPNVPHQPEQMPNPISESKEIDRTLKAPTPELESPDAGAVPGDMALGAMMQGENLINSF